ncbi:class I SAM-dependent methyltransferase [Streptomyces sp. NPDC000404]
MPDPRKLRIPDGVGLPILFVTWLRMLEGQRSDALFKDPFAEAVCAASADSPHMLHIPRSVTATRESMAADGRSTALSAHFAVRTRSLDDRLHAAMRPRARHIRSGDRLRAPGPGHPRGLAGPHNAHRTLNRSWTTAGRDLRRAAGGPAGSGRHAREHQSGQGHP